MADGENKLAALMGEAADSVAKGEEPSGPTAAAPVVDDTFGIAYKKMDLPEAAQRAIEAADEEVEVQGASLAAGNAAGDDEDDEFGFDEAPPDEEEAARRLEALTKTVAQTSSSAEQEAAAARAELASQVATTKAEREAAGEAAAPDAENDHDEDAEGRECGPGGDEEEGVTGQELAIGASGGRSALARLREGLDESAGAKAAAKQAEDDEKQRKMLEEAQKKVGEHLGGPLGEVAEEEEDEEDDDEDDEEGDEEEEEEDEDSGFGSPRASPVAAQGSAAQKEGADDAGGSPVAAATADQPGDAGGAAAALGSQEAEEAALMAEFDDAVAASGAAAVAASPAAGAGSIGGVGSLGADGKGASPLPVASDVVPGARNALLDEVAEQRPSVQATAPDPNAGCCSAPPKLDRELTRAVEQLLGLTKLPYSGSKPQRQLMDCLYTTLMGERAARLARNWTHIGFQRAGSFDTDLRSMGLLGPASIGGLLCRRRSFALDVFEAGCKGKGEDGFPFCLVCINITLAVVKCLRMGRLNGLMLKRNRELHSSTDMSSGFWDVYPMDPPFAAVWSCFDDVFAATLAAWWARYQREGSQPAMSTVVLQAVEKDGLRSVPSLVSGYSVPVDARTASHDWRSNRTNGSAY